jgi:epoxyqueuosine reductase QueG
MNIESIIKEYVAAYPDEKNTRTKWKTPIVKVVSARDKAFETLKTSVRESHLLPKDLLADGQSVIAYFLPFEESVAKTNNKGYYASEEWAVAYVETNTLIADLNTFISTYLLGLGYRTESVPATHNFDEASLMSDWSHRHIAEIAGVGKMGLNNMLITASGCCGRVGSVVTSAPLTFTHDKVEVTCLNHLNGSCGACVNKCPKDAFEGGYDRFKCYEMCLENDAHHEGLPLVDVCGKCLTVLPCSYKNPCA